MICSLPRTLMVVLVLIIISAFLTLTSSSYGPSLRSQIAALTANYPYAPDAALPVATPPDTAGDLQSGFGQGHDMDESPAAAAFLEISSDPQDDTRVAAYGGASPAEDDQLADFHDVEGFVGDKGPAWIEIEEGEALDGMDQTHEVTQIGDDEPAGTGDERPFDTLMDDLMDDLPEELQDVTAKEPWREDVLDTLELDTASPNMTESSSTTSAATATESSSTASAVAGSGVDAVYSKDARYIFAFGDSLTALGFSWADEKPSHGNPFGNPPFPGHTSSGGPNWLDDLILAAPEDTLCYNFATGAAVVDVDIVAPMLSLIPFPFQVANFTSKLATDPHPSFANWTGDNSLAIIWLGVNDVSSMPAFTDDATYQSLTDRIMVSMFDKITYLHASGLKKFVFLGVPPLYRFPFSMVENGYEHAENLTASCHYWNEALQEHTRSFKDENPDVAADVVLVDSFFNEVIDSPRTYGAMNATCKAEDGISCLWIDGLHPGIEIARKVGAGVHAFLEMDGFLERP